MKRIVLAFCFVPVLVLNCTLLVLCAPEPTNNFTNAQTFSEKIQSFRFSQMIDDVKASVKNIRFIPWYTYYTLGRGNDKNGVEHTDRGWDAVNAELRDSGTSFGEFCAQYSAVMTNWAYTLSGIAAILILILKGNKKWYWYMFFTIVTLMSFTSVGMHTADYGEFVRYTMTTKLLASYIDMTLTELSVWSCVLCFTFEFFENRPKTKKTVTSLVSVWTVIILFVLTFEVFVVNNRFLWIGGRGPDGLPYDMGGDHGGLSLAELGCFITSLPLLYVLAANIRKMKAKERRLFILIIITFLTAFFITIPWGDNEINSLAQGNLHGHSIWHIMTAVGVMLIAFWVDLRTTSRENEGELDALKAECSDLKRRLAEAGRDATDDKTMIDCRDTPAAHIGTP